MALLVFILAFIFTPKYAYSAEEFSINQDIEYFIKDNGSAVVTQNFSITNLYSQIYLQEYEITIDQINLSQITAHDTGGDIIKSINTQGDITEINLKFNNPKLGKSQVTDFTLNYLVNEFAVNKGKTWEIQLPVFSSSKNEQLNLKVNLPTTFGELSFSSVNKPQIQNLNDRQVFSTTIDPTSTNNKILLIFGNHQLFSFKLNYYLTNPNTFPIVTEIAIPPDTNTQKITYESITPQPDFVKNDPDGNWLAQYSLTPGQNLPIAVLGQVKVISVLKTPVQIEPSRYLEEKQYWPTKATQITNTVQNLTTPKSIYNFVVNYLNYDFQNFNQATRQGALLALKNPNNALCTEFTDLFVTLARAKGIPAREIEGFAYTNNPKVKPLNPNSDVLHAWPQYYDSNTQTWISVDPTWEKTTNGIDYFSDLDLNHIVFVTHGIDSIYPPPPGSYRDPQNQKTVNVDFATNSIEHDQLPLKIKLENQQLTITNPNLTSINNLIITTKNNKFSIPQLPPLGLVSYKIKSLPFFPVEIGYISNEISGEFTTKVIFKPTTVLIIIGASITFLCLLGIIISSIHNQNEKNT